MTNNEVSLTQIFVFRMTRTATESTRGFLEQLGDELHHMQDDAILDCTEVVDVKEDVFRPWSEYKYKNNYDPQLETLVNEEIEYQRSLSQEMVVSIPMYWVRQETEEEHWQLRFNGMIFANVIFDNSGTDTPWGTYYNDHEGYEVYMGNYESFREAMDAVHKYFGGDD